MLLLLLTLTGVCGKPQEPAGIVGGVTVTKGDLPWITNRYLRCGGSLIHPSWVLTAAHCVYSVGDSIVFNRWNLSAAENGGMGTVANHIRHPQFNTGDPTGEFDLALLRLTLPVREVVPALVVNASQDLMVYPGAMFSVAGWGSLKEGKPQSPILQVAQVPVVANSKCSDHQHYGLIKRIFPSQICAGIEEGGIDACAGDSGSPLFRMVGGHPVVFGVVSWGVGCGREQRPGVYTRVASFRSWIVDQLRVFGDELGEASCAGKCGKQGACNCDPQCYMRQDCCEDFGSVCFFTPPPPHETVHQESEQPPPSCVGRCEDNKNPLKNGYSYCWCDSECLANGDCCESFRQVCVQESLLAQFFPEPASRSMDTGSPTPRPSSLRIAVSPLLAPYFTPSSPPSLPPTPLFLFSNWENLPPALTSFLVPQSPLPINTSTTNLFSSPARLSTASSPSPFSPAGNGDWRAQLDSEFSLSSSSFPSAHDARSSPPLSSAFSSGGPDAYPPFPSLELPPVRTSPTLTILPSPSPSPKMLSFEVQSTSVFSTPPSPSLEIVPFRASSPTPFALANPIVASPKVVPFKSAVNSGPSLQFQKELIPLKTAPPTPLTLASLLTLYRPSLAPRATPAPAIKFSQSRPAWVDYDYDVVPRNSNLRTVRSNGKTESHGVITPTIQKQPETGHPVSLTSRLPLAPSPSFSTWNIPTASRVSAELNVQKQSARPCAGFCKGQSVTGCWCDASCTKTHDCCSDAAACFP